LLDCFFSLSSAVSRLWAAAPDRIVVRQQLSDMLGGTFRSIALHDRRRHRRQLEHPTLRNPLPTPATSRHMHIVLPQTRPWFLESNRSLQAFHWFSNKDSLKEIHRVLKPAGVLGMVWNAEDCM